MTEFSKKFIGPEANLSVFHEPNMNGVIVGAFRSETGMLTAELRFGGRSAMADGDKFDSETVTAVLDKATPENAKRFGVLGRQLLWAFCDNSTRKYPDIEDVEAAGYIVSAMLSLDLHDISLNPPKGTIVTTRPNDML